MKGGVRGGAGIVARAVARARSGDSFCVSCSSDMPLRAPLRSLILPILDPGAMLCFAVGNPLFLWAKERTNGVGVAQVRGACVWHELCPGWHYGRESRED